MAAALFALVFLCFSIQEQSPGAGAPLSQSERTLVRSGLLAMAIPEVSHGAH
jgi:hypothetical protein